MIKMQHKNRPGQFKRFEESNVEAAKANGWEEFDKPKAKAKAKPKKTKK